MRELWLLNCWSLFILYFKRYPITYCLMQCSCLICSISNTTYIFTAILESQPLSSVRLSSRYSLDVNENEHGL